MFVSHEKNVSKKTFQKPNILRRNPKVSKPRANLSNIESPVSISLVNNTYEEEENLSYSLDNITNCETETPTNINQSVWKLTLTNTIEEEAEDNLHGSAIDEIKGNASISSQIRNVEKCLKQSSLNIESFINGGGNAQTIPLHFVKNTSSPEEDTTNSKKKWCFDITNNATDIIIGNCSDTLTDEGEQTQESVIVVPSSLPSDFDQQQIPEYEQAMDEPTPVQIMPVEYFSNRAIKYKCDHPNCSKGFWSEEKLKKHKNSHNRPVVRTPTQAVIECPVKKVTVDGLEEGCPQIFQVRSDLLKHLNEDHTPEDAMYRCGVCGRRFFWAGGLRAHGASRCARGGLPCGWPGCGRVFRLPCRLREHARAHTGDRPYRCRYPECGWAFRSASKLVRHARRHTDERRHACGACGRAFLRREHLRDHAARHHPPAARARARHRCAHAGCEQSFTNMSTLYTHMKKVHRKEPKDRETSNSPDQPTLRMDGDNIYLVSLVDEGSGADEDSSSRIESVASELEGEAAGLPQAGSVGMATGATGAGAEWHAARTHLTWPLPRHTQQHHYVLDDDSHVERAEGSGSDVYTVRSDLFLHGNVPVDEDSQHIVGAADEEVAPLDTDLCLIDAHPTIDLMQEELMYEDAAVDESTFRVFLMNGEELT